MEAASRALRMIWRIRFIHKRLVRIRRIRLIHRLRDTSSKDIRARTRYNLLAPISNMQYLWGLTIWICRRGTLLLFALSRSPDRIRTLLTADAPLPHLPHHGAIQPSLRHRAHSLRLHRHAPSARALLPQHRRPPRKILCRRLRHRLVVDRAGRSPILTSITRFRFRFPGSSRRRKRGSYTWSAARSTAGSNKRRLAR